MNGMSAKAPVQYIGGPMDGHGELPLLDDGLPPERHPHLDGPHADGTGQILGEAVEHVYVRQDMQDGRWIYRCE